VIAFFPEQWIVSARHWRDMVNLGRAFTLAVLADWMLG
jgi:hypothetical protein